jgi:DNA-binding response OmpR family regulator
MTLLLADEEADGALLDALEDRGVAVTVVRDGAQALIEFGRRSPAALIVTARLPLIDGIAVVRAVRAGCAHDDIPILLAVGPDDREQAAAGLTAGASACVSKPYRVNEVLTLVTAVVAGAPAAAGSVVLRAGDVTLDVAAHEVFLAGVPVQVPPQEFRLLQVLLEQAGLVVTRQVLLEKVWGGRDPETNTLAVHVRRLRRRLGDTADAARFIESVRGIGYRIRVP